MSAFSIFDNHHYENFATALVAFAMNNSQEFALDFVNLVLDKGKESKLRDAKVEAAREFGILTGAGKVRRPDLRVDAFGDERRYLFVVEVKIGAGEQPSQLADYRNWLTQERADVKKLVTLTRVPLGGSATPDVELRWQDLKDPVESRITFATSRFERSFWEAFRAHLEETMETFNGFNSQFPDICALMREVDLFNLTLFRDVMKLRTQDLPGMMSACHVPDLRATVGFYWRTNKELGKDKMNSLLVWKDGTPGSSSRVIATFREIVDRSSCAIEENKLTQFLEELGGKVREACEAG